MEGCFSQHLLPIPSNTYLSSINLFGFNGQHPLLRAFDANHRLKILYANVDFPEESYDVEPIKFIKGEISIRTNLERPKTRFDRIKSFPITTLDMTGLVGWAFGVLFGSTSIAKPDNNEYISVDSNFNIVPPRDCIRVIKFDEAFFETGGIDQTLWITYANLLRNERITNVYGMLDYYFKNRLISEWDEIFYNDIAPLVFERIVSSIRIENLSLDLTPTLRYKGGERVISIRLNGATSKTRRAFSNESGDKLKLFSNSDYLPFLKGSVTLNIEKVQIFYSTSHYNGVLFSGFVGDDLIDGTTLYIPENSDEKRNPRKEDVLLVNKLIEHLNSNLEYYNKVLWRNLDPDRRYMLLDGFDIKIYDDFGMPVGERSLASVVKNELAAIVGNSLVFPVAAGYKVSQSFISENKEIGDQERVTLFDHYKPLTPVPPYRISIPTKGVYLETVQSACDACEKVKENTSQDWTKFTTDEPTQIAPITTPVPTITDWKAAFKDFAPPMVNIQNAPGTPEAGVGLAGLADLLSKAGIFKDLSGLDANQQNVIRTYLSNQENAKAFAEMAASMLTQQHNTQNSDKIMDNLSSAKDSGAISEEDHSKLVKQHFQQQIDWIFLPCRPTVPVMETHL